MNALIEAINQAGRIWWPYVFHVTWTSSLVVVLLLFVIRIGRRWPAQLRYGIILIALMKFAIPPTLAIPVGVFTRFGPAVVQETEELAINDEAITAWAQISWQSRLMLLHVLGSLVTATYILSQLAKLAKMARRAQSVNSGPYYELFFRLSGQLGLRRSVRLLVSAEPVTPMAFGLLRPQVLVPVSVLRDLPAEQARTILAHELAHHRRADLWINSAQILLGTIWWFNPLVRLLNRVLRRIREDCCDDLLLCRKMTTDGTYCQALLTVASDLSRAARLNAALAFAQALHPLAGRIRRIMDPGLHRLSRSSLGTIATMSLLAVLLLPGLSSREPVATDAYLDSLGSSPGLPIAAGSGQISDERILAAALETQGHTVELRPDSAPPVHSQGGLYVTALLNQPLTPSLKSSRLTLGFDGKVPASTSGSLVLSVSAKNFDRTSARSSSSAPEPLSPYVHGPNAIDWPGFGQTTLLLAQAFASSSDLPENHSGDDDQQESGPDVFADDSEDSAPDPFRLPRPDAPDNPEGDQHSPIYVGDSPDLKPDPLHAPDAPDNREDNYHSPSPIYAGDSPNLKPEPLRSPAPSVPDALDRHEQQFQRFAGERLLDKLFRTQPYVLAQQTRMFDSILSRKTASTLAVLRSSDVVSSAGPEVSLAMADFADTLSIEPEGPSDSGISSSAMDVAEAQPSLDVPSPPDALVSLDPISEDVLMDSPEAVDLVQVRNIFDATDVYEPLALDTESPAGLITIVSTVRELDVNSSIVSTVSPDIAAWQEPVDMADTFVLAKASILAEAPKPDWNPAPAYRIVAMPEPLTLGLLSVGMSVLLLGRRRLR